MLTDLHPLVPVILGRKFPVCHAVFTTAAISAAAMSATAANAVTTTSTTIITIIVPMLFCWCWLSLVSIYMYLKYYCIFSCVLIHFAMQRNASPKDDDCQIKKREDVRKEVEHAKRALAQQVQRNFMTTY